MSQVITAVFEDGVLKPEKHLDLPARTRVRITVELLEHPNGSIEWAWGELEQLWDDEPVEAAGPAEPIDQSGKPR